MCSQEVNNNVEVNENSPEQLTSSTENPIIQNKSDFEVFREIIRQKKLNSQTETLGTQMNEQSEKDQMGTDAPKSEDQSSTAENTTGVYSGNDLLNMPIDNTPHLWEPIIFKQGLMVLTGSSDVGKSSFLRDLAIAIALKETSFLDHPLNVEHGRVIYYTTEENQSSISTCLRRQSTRIGKKDLSGLKYIFSIENPWDTILKEMNRGPVDAIIIDCFADLFDGNINDNGQVRSYLQEISELSVRTKTLFILLHHNGKRTEYGAPSKNSMIGSQGFEAKVRLVLEIRKEGDTTRSLWITKGNDIAESKKRQGMQLNFDENQHFTFVGKSDYVSTSINNKFAGNKEKIVASIVSLLAQNEKISYDKILLQLQKEFPTSAPSKGTLCKWIKEIKDNNISKAA